VRHGNILTSGPDGFPSIVDTLIGRGIPRILTIILPVLTPCVMTIGTRGNFSKSIRLPLRLRYPLARAGL